MTRRASLHIVSSDTPVDITALNRAAILERDWSACHVAGDKGPRINLPEKRRKWGYS